VAIASKTDESMILEQAILQVRQGQETDFETAMRQAQPLIAATPGFVRLELRDCIESPGKYLLLVWWRKLENHTIDFRQSERYQQWRALLHHFYDPFPVVEHYTAAIITSEAAA
jgi:heme-degrading monooxygenase HmoA